MRKEFTCHRAREYGIINRGGQQRMPDKIGITRQDSAETFLDLQFNEFNWQEIKKNLIFIDFLVNLFFSKLPSFWDIVSDLLLAYASYHTDGDLFLDSSLFYLWQTERLVLAMTFQSTITTCRIKQKIYIKNPAYGRQRISRPMRIIGPIQFWKDFVIYL